MRFCLSGFTSPPEIEHLSLRWQPVAREGKQVELAGSEEGFSVPDQAPVISLKSPCHRAVSGLSFPPCRASPSYFFPC